MDTRRTRPYYLSEGEALMEKSRLVEMVKGFKRFEQVIRIGETKGFVVDYDRQENLVIIYGKEIPKLCAFKLAFNESETKEIADLLLKAKAYW